MSTSHYFPVNLKSACLMLAGWITTGLPPWIWNTGGSSEVIWPVSPELDLAVEGLGVHRGERIAHLLRIDRIGGLDRELQDRAGGRGRGLGIVGLALVFLAPRPR